MIFSHKWLQEYFEEPLPKIEELGELLTFHAFEIEEIKGDIIDIDVLPNRSHDCFCYAGIAREIATLTGLTLKKINRDFKVEKGLKSWDLMSLQIEDIGLVPRATKRLVQNVKIGASPDWLREKLESIGQKSINNIVDITNYVMWQTGQPVHAFDFHKVAGEESKEFFIRKAENGEKITTLDGQEFELDESILVIADREKALDIAGTKGGIVSGIDGDTKDVVLSVCNFNAANIRKTSRKLSLRTDASQRFENNISPEKVMEAMLMLSKLVVEICGGKVSEDVLEVYPRKANQFKVGVSVREVNSLLGLDLSDLEIENIFKKLDFDFEKVMPLDRILEMAPQFENKSYKYGASVSYDAPELFDCSSFTAFLFAQAGIGIPRVSIDQCVWGEEIEKQDLRAGDLIFSNGGKGEFRTETLEFLKGTKVEEGIDHVGLFLGDGKVIHASRNNSEGGGVKTELLEESISFKNIVGYRRMTDNQERYVITVSHERLDLRIKEDLIEEIGRIYGYRNIESKNIEKIFEPKINKEFFYINKIKNILLEEGFSELMNYTFGDSGVVEVQKPLASNLALLRTNLKDGILKSLELNVKNAPVLGLDEIKVFEIGKVFPNIDGEYLSLALGVNLAKKNKKAVSLQEEIIKNALLLVQKELDINFEIKIKDGIFEINLDKVIEQLPEVNSYGNALEVKSDENIIFQKISHFPFMLRDIAVWVSNENTAEDLLNLIKEKAGELLVQVRLFDSYTPEEEERTSYAYKLVFQSQEKTLTDEEINRVMDVINTEIKVKGWEVR